VPENGHNAEWMEGKVMVSNKMIGHYHPGGSSKVKNGLRTFVIAQLLGPVGVPWQKVLQV